MIHYYNRLFSLSWDASFSFAAQRVSAHFKLKLETFCRISFFMSIFDSVIRFILHSFVTFYHFLNYWKTWGEGENWKYTKFERKRGKQLQFWPKSYKNSILDLHVFPKNGKRQALSWGGGMGVGMWGKTGQIWGGGVGWEIGQKRDFIEIWESSEAQIARPIN